MIDKNFKGEFALYDKGALTGYAAVTKVGGVRIVATMKPILISMIEAAKTDSVNLTLAAGLRTFGEQYALRKQNVIDKSKVSDEEYLLTQPSGLFKPATGKPGFSNHQDGKAYDFNVTGKPEVYKWLVLNALRFGFIRTVLTERWHWEYMPGVRDQFAYVKKSDPTWDGLV